MGGPTLWLLDHDPEAGLGFALRSLVAPYGFETVVVPSPAGGLHAIAGEPSLIAGRVWLPSPLQGFEGCGGLRLLGLAPQATCRGSFGANEVT